MGTRLESIPVSDRTKILVAEQKELSKEFLQFLAMENHRLETELSKMEASVEKSALRLQQAKKESISEREQLELAHTLEVRRIKNEMAEKISTIENNYKSEMDAKDKDISNLKVKRNNLQKRCEEKDIVIIQSKGMEAY